MGRKGGMGGRTCVGSGRCANVAMLYVGMVDGVVDGVLVLYGGSLFDCMFNSLINSGFERKWGVERGWLKRYRLKVGCHFLLNFGG